MREEIDMTCIEGNDHSEGPCQECEAKTLGWSSYAEMMERYVGW
jgi:hypothetical protein